MRLSLIATASFVTMLAACSNTPSLKASAPVASTSSAPRNASAPASTDAQASAVKQAQIEAERQAALVRKTRADLNNMSVLFDFDDYTVKPEYTDMLQRQADFLKTQAGDRLVLQGNSDERGGAEYNLALGQKRAEAVRKALLVLGAPDDRIETISFGKEKPKATCPEESCWSQNRRADFVHSSKH
ncbi:MAG TPA: peptidoglycan-associated lipoprotein Pal [Aquabacterium sp.]|uniref:peptidoglycan-associated lipoprotein Pal n=1 Tax=Aquabacterium sp. TaxID=1872578 RepID=UPI002E30D53A|nr:peptidoglycan-associated lipoprotein Pal [Aquabacterium sp.]HEX5356756.1 peptidoglycan-associated lipoprotein Pal [Aquabacterium sp.]